MTDIKSEDDGTLILLSSTCSPLLTTLSLLRGEETNKDVFFRCRSGVEVRCHSPVLFAFCSPTFRNILNSVSLMDEEGVLVVIDEVDGEDVESFLDLIYLGQCKNTSGLQFLTEKVFRVEPGDANEQSSLFRDVKLDMGFNIMNMMGVKKEPCENNNEVDNNNEELFDYNNEEPFENNQEESETFEFGPRKYVHCKTKNNVDNFFIREMTANLLKTASEVFNDEETILEGDKEQPKLKICPYCKETIHDGNSRGNEKFVNHLMIHENGQKGWKCNQCDFKSSQRKSLASHVKAQHMQSNWVLCPECGESFGNDILFKRHHKKTHGGSTFDCQDCEFKAIHQSSLLRHKKRVHEGQKFVCDQCDYQCKYQQDLKRHILSAHEGVRYHCDQCDYKATEKGSLKKHQQSIHEGIKYGCDQCSYQATDKRNLTKHKRNIHEGVLYDCDQCPHKSKSQSNLWVHKQGVHKNIKFFCDQCGYQTARKSYLNIHKSTKHSEQNENS